MNRETRVSLCALQTALTLSSCLPCSLLQVQEPITKSDHCFRLTQVTTTLHR